MNLKEQLQSALGLPESDFSRHETDLYVADNDGRVMQWLRKNYSFYKQVSIFIGASGSTLARKRCLDIPFAAWDEKYKPKKDVPHLMDTNSV